MPSCKHELVVSIVVVLLISAFIEFLYGLHILGFVFLALLILVLSFVSKDITSAEYRKNLRLAMIGMVIVVSVLIYNYMLRSDWGNLDVMTILFGSSLILMGSTNRNVSMIARFTACMSLLFVIFFLFLYSIPRVFSIPLPYYYGHYMVTLPVATVLKHLGLNVDVPSMRIIRVNGVEPLNLKIELSCFGWYSLLLALSTVLSYSLTIKKIERRKLMIVLLVVSVTVYLANLLRIAILVTVAYFYGLKTMMMFHTHAGWILFAMILIPIMYFITR